MRRLTLIAPFCLTAAAIADEPGFWLTHDPTGDMKGYLYAFSQDGLIAVGSSWGGNPWKSPGFSWTAAGGRYDFGLERGMPMYSGAYAVSSDGGTIVGVMGELHQDPSYVMEYEYRRVGNGPLEDLGKLAKWPFSRALGVSGDGQIVVGTCKTSEYWSSAFGEPFRWTAQTGMVGLGHLKPTQLSYTTGEGISRDGTTIVGTSRSKEYGPYEAYRWTAQTGMVQLPGLPGMPDDYYGAEAVNADGSVVVGWVAKHTYPYAEYPVRWVDGRIEALGPDGGGRMYAVDDSGNVIGGGEGAPTIWTRATGLMYLEDYLAGFGIHPPDGVLLYGVLGISGDGLSFGGFALANGNWRGFVATIPAPCAADCDKSGELDIDDFICFQTLFGLGDAAADCDKSGGLDFDDFTCFSAAFAAGCP